MHRMKKQHFHMDGFANMTFTGTVVSCNYNSPMAR